MGAGKLLGSAPCADSLLLEHVAERIEQHEDEQKEKGVQDGKGSKAHTRVDNETKNFHGGFGGVLQNIPRVEPNKTPNVNPETAQARDSNDKYPACPAPESSQDDVLNQVEGDYAKQHSRP